MPKDEQARSLMGEWSNFADNGEKNLRPNLRKSQFTQNQLECLLSRQ